MEPITRVEQYLSAIANGTTDVPDPITRNEKYLYAIAKKSGDVPVPITRIEHYLNAIHTGSTDVPHPITRNEQYLYAIATGDKSGIPETPVSRTEHFIANIAGVDVGGGGGDDDTLSEWGAVFKAIKDGTYKEKYKIGDVLPLDLGPEGMVNAQIVAFDTDVLADGSGKAPITWITEQLLNTSRRMNPAYSAGVEGTGSLGGYHKTEMYAYIQETLKPLFPAEVRSGIKNVTKYTIERNVSGRTADNVKSTEDVWLPSRQEILGSYENEQSGVYYSESFPDNASRIKKKIGETSSSYWWLRSAYSGANFFCVNTSGYINYYGSNSLFAVALGFCT